MKDIQSQEQLMKDADKPGHRIAMLQKVKDENVRLIKETHKIKSEFEKKEEAFRKAMEKVNKMLCLLPET